ncbi:MAG: hypothetical protein ABI543_08935, partial [Ignavibacteria bacterium]
MDEDKISNNYKTTGRNNRYIMAVSFLLLLFVSVIAIWYFYSGKSDYEKGTSYLKEKKITEALYEFQKVSPDNKDFNNAQSKINYINGLESYNAGRNSEALVFLSKVRTDDEYYHDSQLMMEKMDDDNIGSNIQSQIDSLKNKKDTVIVRKEVTVNHGTTKDPVDPAIQADLEITRKFVSDASNSISRFESVYQSARTAPLTTKSDYGKSMESVDKEFGNIRYAANNKDAGVIELKRIAADWMNKRIAFIRQLISEKSVSETNLSRPLKEEGDRLYSSMMSQLNKV